MKKKKEKKRNTVNLFLFLRDFGLIAIERTPSLVHRLTTGDI